MPHLDLQTEADAVHAANIDTIAIGIGRTYDRTQLEMMATSPDKIFTMTNFQDLSGVFGQLPNKSESLSIINHR